MERKLQSEIATYLRRKGAFVLTVQPQAGIPTGTPDIIALFNNEWIAIEVKASKSSKFQPLQEATIKKLKKMSPFTYVAYPENWDKVRQELEQYIFND